MRVTLYQQTKINGRWIKRKALSRNGKLKAVESPCNYFIRYAERMEPVGKEADVAMAAAKRKALTLDPIPGVTVQQEENTSSPSLDSVIATYLVNTQTKARKTFLAYRLALERFRASCPKIRFGDVTRDDMIAFTSYLQKHPSRYAAETIHSIWIRVAVFFNDRGIRKYVEEEDWVKGKDIPKYEKNTNKKYASYTDQGYQAMLMFAPNDEAKLLVQFLAGTGFRKDETAHAEFSDVKGHKIETGAKPKYNWKTKDNERREVEITDALATAIKNFHISHPDRTLIFSDTTTPNTHLDRIIRKTAEAAHVTLPKKPCHAFRVRFATKRSSDIETLRRELGHSDITTTQIYLRGITDGTEQKRLLVE